MDTVFDHLGKMRPPPEGGGALDAVQHRRAEAQLADARTPFQAVKGIAGGKTPLWVATLSVTQEAFKVIAETGGKEKPSASARKKKSAVG